MNYQQALDYIHSISWRGSVPGLSRTQELLRRLGQPQKALRFVHVAGTNGKGSTCAMLASILMRAGYRTGLYISPFIERFNERMQVNGQAIADEALAALTARVRPHAEAMADHPTEFELITAIAMLYFQQCGCDIVVLEAGMGGALDSTNVIDTPELAIITAMGFDHVRELGPTMADIAAAKAGIIKPGGTVVSFGENPEADAVICQACRTAGAALHAPDFTLLAPGRFDLSGQSFSYGAWRNLDLPLAGTYQLKNAAVVLTAAGLLREKGFAISDGAVREGLQRTRWPARFELLRRDPIFILDGGHNPHGVRAMAESLAQFFPSGGILFLTGILADKDADAILKTVLPLAARFFTVQPDSPRAMTAEALAERIRALGGTAEACADVPDAVSRSCKAAGAAGVVCAFGSLYMSGAVRRCVQKRGVED